jgi:transcriptional regulator with XRE-family HTH domain
MSSETISSEPSFDQVAAEEELSHIVDAFVGRKIRSMRSERKMTMAHLAASIGVTWQQLQKYESGANRIGSSKLYAIAQTLEIEVEALFSDLPRLARQNLTKTVIERAAFASSSDGVLVIDAVRHLPSEIREETVNLVLLIAACFGTG